MKTIFKLNFRRSWAGILHATLAAGLVAALAALRILMALVSSLTAASVGSGTALAGALLETGEAVFGMVLAAAAIPIAAQFWHETIAPG